MKSQFVISNRGGDRALPYAFTELGIAMLSSVLRSETAIQVNINIMRAFVMIRQTVAAWQATNLRVEQLSHKVDALSSRVDEMLRVQHENNMELAVQIDAINDALDQLREPPEKPRKRIGFRTRNEANDNGEKKYFFLLIIHIQIMTTFAAGFGNKTPKPKFIEALCSSCD